MTSKEIVSCKKRIEICLRLALSQLLEAEELRVGLEPHNRGFGLVNQIDSVRGAIRDLMCLPPVR